MAQIIARESSGDDRTSNDIMLLKGKNTVFQQYTSVFRLVIC